MDRLRSSADLFPSTGIRVDGDALAFQFFLAAIAAIVAYQTWRGGARAEGRPRRAWGWITVVGVISGAVSGFFGVGGAFVAPPLLTTFGQAGAGLFVAPSVLEKEVARQFGVTVVGRLDAVREKYFAISV